MTNEQIDLELFKVCFPNTNRVRIPRTFSFVDPVYGIINCFSVLIPEMNRRGFDFDVYVYVSGSGYAEFWKGYEKSSVDFHNRNELPAAISKAAYAALKGEK